MAKRYKKKAKRRARTTNALIALLAAVLLACAVYYWYNYIYLPQKINSRNESFSGLYKKPEPTEETAETAPVPTEESTAETVLTSEPADEPSPALTAVSADNTTAGPTEEAPRTATAEPETDAAPTAAPSITATAETSPGAETKNSSSPDSTPEPTPAATPEPTPAATSEPTLTPKPETSPSPTAETVDDVRLGTANPDTVIYSAAEAPEPNGAFDRLLEVNPETVGFLTMGDMLELPVARKLNDNEYYLSHDFAGEESKAGCLFMDGNNRIWPRDKILFVYGHNMKNGTMFGMLSDFSRRSTLSRCPIIGFDTLYEEAKYIPFASFTLTADQSSRKYFEIRRFGMTEEETQGYIDYLRAVSLIDIPVDVRPDDDMLMLVTCSYDTGDSRYVLALRKLRDGESENVLGAIVNQSSEKKR